MIGFNIFDDYDGPVYLGGNFSKESQYPGAKMWISNRAATKGGFDESFEDEKVKMLNLPHDVCSFFSKSATPMNMNVITSGSINPKIRDGHVRVLYAHFFIPYARTRGTNIYATIYFAYGDEYRKYFGNREKKIADYLQT